MGDRELARDKVFLVFSLLFLLSSPLSSLCVFNFSVLSFFRYIFNFPVFSNKNVPKSERFGNPRVRPFFSERKNGKKTIFVIWVLWISSCFPSKHGHSAQTRCHKNRVLERNESHCVIRNHIVWRDKTFFVKNKRSHAVVGNYIFGCGRNFFDDSILHGAVIYYSIFGGKKSCWRGSTKNRNSYP